MSEDEERDQEDARWRGNLYGAITVAVLVVIGLLLMRWLSNYEQTSDCIAAGHRDCVPVDQP